MEETAELLRSVEVFAGLGAAAAERLAAETVERRFAAGTHILRRGEPGDRMFVLAAGEVQVPIVDDRGKVRFQAHLGPGQVFGEMALLTGEPRTADVIAQTDCHCLQLDKDVVEDLMRETPEIARLLTAILGERLISIGGIRRVGKYRLAGEVGRGRVAIVYEAVHPTLDRPVAIKMLAHELVYHPHFAARFRNEARILAGLRHPNIVEVYDTEEAYATFFIVMERLPGASLDEAIRARGGLAYELVRDVARQLAAALDCAHSRGVIHRDVKPSNVALGPEGQVKLMDFGLALETRVGEGETAEEPVGMGTPLYMAPEQITGEHVDVRADIYSLGIVTYQMLTGEPPFQGNMYQLLHQHLHKPVPDLRERLPDLPSDLEALVLRATAKAPQDRFASCGEILELLGTSATGSALSRVAVRTLTFLFEPAQRPRVEEIVEQAAQQAARVPGVIVR